MWNASLPGAISLSLGLVSLHPLLSFSLDQEPVTPVLSMLNILKDSKFTELLDASNIQTCCSASFNWVDSGCYERKRGKVVEENGLQSSFYSLLSTLNCTQLKKITTTGFPLENFILKYKTQCIFPSKKTKHVSILTLPY